MNTCRRLMLPCISLFLLNLPLHAFQITPNQSRYDSKLASMAGFQQRVCQEASEHFLFLFKSPVHEAITQAAFGCDKDDLADCAKKNHASVATIWGSRWNDDPPFRMTSGPSVCKFDQTIRANTQPACWYAVFTDAEKKSAAGQIFGPGYALLYRVHFGDLQFLHSMANQDGDSPETTRGRIMMWAQFAWGIATGTLPRDHYLRDLGIAGLGGYFPGDQSATILFSLGNPAFQNQQIAEVALGSLLHMVEDSFSKSHVSRSDPLGQECDGMPGVVQPGLILQFHSYAHQNKKAHDLEDRIRAIELQKMETVPCAIDVCRTIVQLWQRKATWPEAQRYLQYVFALHPSASASGPGKEFEL